MTVARQPRTLAQLSAADWAIVVAASLLVAECVMPWRVRVISKIGAELTVTTPVVALPRPADLRIIDEKPLFVASRQPWRAPLAPPPPAASAPPVPPASEPAGYRLEGTAISSHGRFALIWSQARSSTIRLELNQVLDGWTLVAIAPDSLQFVNGDRRYLMAFDRPTGAPAPAPPGGPSPSPMSRPFSFPPR